MKCEVTQYWAVLEDDFAIYWCEDVLIDWWDDVGIYKLGFMKFLVLVPILLTQFLAIWIETLFCESDTYF